MENAASTLITALIEAGSIERPLVMHRTVGRMNAAAPGSWRRARPWAFGPVVALVDGILSADLRRVMAQDIWRDNGRGTWTQSS